MTAGQATVRADAARTGRGAPRLAWSCVVLAPALAVGGRLVGPDTDTVGVDEVAGLAILLVLAILGALVAGREPHNPIGWILCALPLGAGLIGFAEGYLDRHDPDAGEWLSNWAWIPFVFIPLAFLPLYFPHGRLLSRRWRLVPRCAAGGIVLFWFSQAFAAGSLYDAPDVENPFGIDHPLVDAAGIGFLFAAGAIIAGAAAVVIRFRRSEGVEREQMKWLAYAACVAVTSFILAVPLSIVFSDDVGNAVVLAGILTLPVAMAIAILRHRLYDIDILINRTLVYGGLTASVVLVYVVVVGGVSLLFHDRATPWLALPATGLAAVLVQPLRAWLQRHVDRVTHGAGSPAPGRGTLARVKDIFAPEAAELRRARERLVGMREEERRRLRRDLHDGLGPALAGAALKLDAAEHLLDRDPRAAAQLLGGAGAEIRDAVTEIRRLVYELRPPALDELGLPGALREQAGRLADAAPTLQIEVDAGELGELPAAVEVAAYRIGVEAMTNVARHAGARACRIALERGGGELLLAVTDDGRGLPRHHHPGVGVASMAERAEELGGTCLVESAQPSGTRVYARIPVRAT